MKKILNLLTITTLLGSPAATLIQDTSAPFVNNFYWVNIQNVTHTPTFSQNFKKIAEFPVIDITATTRIRTIESFYWLYEIVSLPNFYAKIEPFETKQEVKSLNIPVTTEWEEDKTLAPTTLIDYTDNTPILRQAKLSYSISISKHPGLGHLLLKIIFLGSATENIIWHPEGVITSGEDLIFRGR